MQKAIIISGLIGVGLSLPITAAGQACDATPYQPPELIADDPVMQRCHDLSTRPFHDGTTPDGVDYQKLDAAMAIPACAAALDEYPDHPRIQYQYARSLDRGEKRKAAFPWYKKSAEKRYPPALAKMGDIYVYDVIVERDRAVGLDMFKQAACAGDLYAKMKLGDMYKWGLGVDENFDTALKYYAESADGGWPDAEYTYGDYLLKGINVARDTDKALDYILSAAGKGHLNAQHLYGFAHGEGYWDVSKDENVATEYYLMAAAQGGVSAMGNLGMNYRYGTGSEKDPEKSAYWSRMSAYDGTPWGLYKVAELYDNGFGLTQDKDKAKELFLKAAKVYEARISTKTPDPDAAYWLGTLYENGYGVEKDYDRAVDLYQIGAKGHSENAKSRLKRLGIAIETTE